MKSCRKEAKISVSSRVEDDELVEEINLQKLSFADDNPGMVVGGEDSTSNNHNINNTIVLESNSETPNASNLPHDHHDHHDHNPKHHPKHHHHDHHPKHDEEDYHDFLVSLPTPDDIEGSTLFDNDDEDEEGQKTNATSSSLSSKCPSSCKMKNNTCMTPGGNSQCLHSLYGQPKPSSVLREIMKSPSHCDPNGGLLWKVYLVPDDYNVNYEKHKSLKRVPKAYYDADQKCIKPRRGHMMATYSEFMSSLQKVPMNHDGGEDADDDDHHDPTADMELYQPQSKWLFSGVLNGWPGLQTFELLTIEYKRPLLNWNVHWSAQEYEKAHDIWSESPVQRKSTVNATAVTGTKGTSSTPTIPTTTAATTHATVTTHATSSSASAPTIPTYFGISEVRARLRAPAHSADGWSKTSPGFVFWFEGNQTRKEGDRLLYGTNIIKEWEQESKTKFTPSPKCTKVHKISHRYATGNKQQIRDYLTYHSLALLEWDHGKYCTVVELAYLGGVGGYQGRSNWIEDKNESPSSLYKAMPPEMIHPWKVDKSEIRCFDINVQSLSMFLMYMQKYTGQDKRFIDVRHTFSHEVRLSFCAREHIAQYLINYIRRIRSYSEIRRNCQTFAADFCAFLAGKKDVQPFHPINRGGYKNQTHTFMYDSTMYNLHHHHHHHE